MPERLGAGYENWIRPCRTAEYGHWWRVICGSPHQLPAGACASHKFSSLTLCALSSHAGSSNDIAVRGCPTLSAARNTIRRRSPLSTDVTSPSATQTRFLLPEGSVGDISSWTSARSISAAPLHRVNVQLREASATTVTSTAWLSLYVGTHFPVAPIKPVQNGAAKFRLRRKTSAPPGCQNTRFRRELARRRGGLHGTVGGRAGGVTCQGRVTRTGAESPFNNNLPSQTTTGDGRPRPRRGVVDLISFSCRAAARGVARAFPGRRRSRSDLPVGSDHGGRRPDGGQHSRSGQEGRP